METAIEIVDRAPLLDRSSLLDTIDTIFQADTDVIIIRGQEEIGKTTLLKQFAFRHTGAVIGIFINAQTRWAYDEQNILTDIYQNLVSLLNQRSELTESITLGVIRGLYIKLSRRMRMHSRCAYFILDGIDDIPASDDRSRRAILDMLPIGYGNFKFLVTTEKPINIKNARDYFVAPFSTDETANLFSGLGIARKQVEEIRRTFRGVPGHMMAVRRIAKQHQNPAELFEDLPKTLAEIFELEWRGTNDAPDYVLDALAIIAIDRKDYTYSLLSGILNQEISSLQRFMGSLSFIELSTENVLTYSSDSYRNFAATKLRARHTNVNNALVDYLLRDPSSDAAIRDVPGYLYEARRFVDLLKYLSPTHFTTLLERSESLASIQQKAQLGVKTAGELHRYGDLFRFGVQLSSTAIVAGVDTWRTEIEARIALNDSSSAKQIVLNTLLKENRFHLLAVIGKTQRELHETIDPDILTQIDQLFNEINFEELGSKGHEIAADLIFVRPNLAIQIIEKLSKDRAEKSVLEWELARLSFDAAREQLPKEREYQTAQLIQSKLNNPGAQRFSSAAWLFLGTYTADEAIAEVEKIKDTGERLSLLRLWTRRNRRRCDTKDVVKYALEIAIRETSYSINAQVLMDLAQPLPFIEDEAARRTFLGMFDAQRSEAERLGPTDSYVNMYLLMIQTEKIHDHSSAFLKITDLYIQISYINDVSTRASCLAKLISAMHEIDPTYELERTDRLHSIASDEFRATIDKLFHDSAEQLAAINATLKTLARSDYMLAADTARRLNSLSRRDDAFMIILQAILSGELDAEQVGNGISACEAIRSADLRDYGFYLLTRSVFEGANANQFSDRTIETLKSHVSAVESLEWRCRSVGLIYAWLLKNDRPALRAGAADLRKSIEKTWESIESAWIKTDVGFDLVRNLNATDVNFTQGLLSQCDTLRRELVFGVDTSISIYALCIQLTIRAFSGLFVRKIDNEMDLSRLQDLITRIPCRSAQARAWGDLALRFALAQRSEECKKIVSSKITPLLDALYSTDPRMADIALTLCAPALYSANALFTMEYIKKLPYPRQDQAWMNICDSIMLKRNPFDDFDRPLKFDAKLSYEEIREVIFIAENIFADNILYSVVSDIAQIVSSKKNKSILSAQQRTEIIRKLETIIQMKLPNREFVQHDGWKILALAQLERVRHSAASVWNSLLGQARAIPNVADRVLVLAGLGGMSWSDFAQSSGQVLEEAYQLVKLIPTTLDRTIRLRAIASECSHTEPAIARKCLSDAMTVAVTADEADENAANERRRIIDLAYKIDPGLADKLADIADTDPARVRAREELRHEIRVLKGKQDIFGTEDVFSAARSNAQLNSLIEAAGRALAALNAGRMQPLDKDRVEKSIRFASNRPFSETYPLFALAVESMVKRYRDTAEAANYLRAIFDGAVRATELVWRVAVRTNGNIPIPAPEHEQTDTSSILIKVGERDRALEFIENWLKVSAIQHLKICDPYFSHEDLDLIKMIQAAAPAVRIQILTGMKNQEGGGHAADLASSYRSYWRLNLADQPAPETEIWIVGTERDGTFPIHDRWILSVDSGLRLGTSLNGFGSRESEISILSTSEVSIRTAELERYFSKQVKEHQGQKIKYNFFDL